MRCLNCGKTVKAVSKQATEPDVCPDCGGDIEKTESPYLISK